ncbi:MAG TPA: hypothetical protein VNZ64_10560 [Candidatus Acidoferrum sp.]|jgi:glucose-6-phosphate isomerase|nr:hypothetical protein [Candidatus Acidoferrum sp.]
MAILRYRDLFQLFSNYLQHVVMVSVDKQLDLDGKAVNRKVGLHVSLDNVNVYHKPCVQPFKKVDSAIIEMLLIIHEYFTKNTNHSFADPQISNVIGKLASVETVLKNCDYLSVDHKQRLDKAAPDSSALTYYGTIKS